MYQQSGAVFFLNNVARSERLRNFSIKANVGERSILCIYGKTPQIETSGRMKHNESKPVTAHQDKLVNIRTDRNL